jgi:hypothetical protein
MKKKVLILSVALTLLFSGVVVAASMYGEFEGYPIIQIKNNGKTIIPQDVPAISFEGRTMIPIYMLRDLGLNVSWDQETQTVNVSSSTQTSNPGYVFSKKEFDKLISKARQYDANYIQYSYAGGTSTFLVANYKDTLDDDVDEDFRNIAEISKLTLETDAGLIIFEINVNGTITEEVSIFREDIEDYVNGKINYSEYILKWSIYPANNIAPINNTPNYNNSSTMNTSSGYPELYSNDGKTYLGKLTTNEFDAESIFNEYGTYGSPYSSKSIWNEYGKYGSKYSNESAFNEYATKPPIIVFDGEIIGYLTTNAYINSGISPYELYSWLEENGY